MNAQYLFTLPADSGEDFVAAEHLPLVVYFYPKDSTPGCTTEAQGFRDSIAAFKAAGYTVVGISRDSVKSHQNFVCKQELNFPLLSDKEETVCKQFDVIKEKNMYGKKVMGIERSTFVCTGQAAQDTFIWEFSYSNGLIPLLAVWGRLKL